MEKYTVSQVFVPGGMPEHTYVSREGKKLEEKLRASYSNLCKLVTVTGVTKSGKTVLAKKIFPKDKSIWIDGGTVTDENDLWTSILGKLGGYTTLGTEKSNTSGTNVSGSLEGSINAIVAKGKATVGGEISREQEDGKSTELTLNPRPAAVMQLLKSKHPLIIDDFHYLKRNIQGHVIRALKSVIFEGLPVVLIAIPHRRYDAIKVEREFTGRLEAIPIPTWDDDELMNIALEGFPLLNVYVSRSFCRKMVREAYGSPHLMQEFCKALALAFDIKETLPEEKTIPFISNDLFEKIAQNTGKVIFEKLARGPRRHGDRVMRKLRTGEEVDIYRVILLALAHLSPGMETVEYDDLSKAINEILTTNIPQASEVIGVLEDLSKIAASDENSTPVLDWEAYERRLHITDPFFAFYLKWGARRAKH